MDLLSFCLGFLASLWGLTELVYPRESAWFHRKWLDYLEKKLQAVSLIFLFSGSLFLFVVWRTNNFLILLVLGSFLLYTGFKYLVLGSRFIELSRKSLELPDWRRRLMGLWLLIGGLGLIYLSSWF